MTIRKDYLPVLDGLRAIAVLLVLWEHMPRNIWHWRIIQWRDAIGPGYLGVDIFFVLSGFLITRILLVDRMEGTPLRYFLARRALRIFPIYYLLLTVVAIVAMHDSVPYAAVYLSNFYFAINPAKGPLNTTWSLAVEEHFYLVWPLVVYLLSIRQSRRVLILGIVPCGLLCAVILAMAMDPYPGRAMIIRGTFCRMLSLGLGAILAYHESILRMRTGQTKLLAIAILAVGITVVQIGVNHLSIAWQAVSGLAGYGLISMGIVILGIEWSVRPVHFARTLTIVPLRYIGRISYGLYLYHYPIYFALELHKPADPAVHLWMTLLAVAMTFTVAVISWHGIESRILKLKVYFKSLNRANVAASKQRKLFYFQHSH